MTPGEADPPGPDGLHLLTALHPAAHTPLLHHRARLDLPGRPLLRLHLPHHHRTGRLHPWRPPGHGTVPGPWKNTEIENLSHHFKDILQDLRGTFLAVWTCFDIADIDCILRHSSAQPWTPSAQTQVQ